MRGVELGWALLRLTAPPVGGGGDGRGHEGAAGGGTSGAWAGAVPVPGVRDSGASV